MKISKIVKSKKLLALALAGIVGFGSVAPAFAATETEQTGSTTLKVTTQAVTINMTVPSTIEMTFNADGSNTVPTNYLIKNNNAYSNVTLEKAAFVGQNEWQMAGENATLALDEKAMKLKLGAAGAEVAAVPIGGATAKNTNATAAFAQTFVIPKSNSKKMSFVVTRPDYSKATGITDAFGVTFTFDLESVSAAK